MDVVQQLHDTVERSNAAGVAAAAGAAVNGMRGSNTALHWACQRGSAECVRLLLAASADPALRGQNGWCAIHLAALRGHAECIAALLGASADPLATVADGRYVPQAGDSALHIAAMMGHLPAVRLLLQAAPQAVLMLDGWGRTPITSLLLLRPGPRSSIYADRMAVARYLLDEAPIEADDTGTVLTALRDAGEWAVPLYPLLVARLPLTAEQWARAPSPCAGLGAALPAVLQRSEAEAAQLVRHLPAADQQHLRALALCLGAAARRGLLPPLPTPIVHRLLAECAAHAVSH